MATNICKTCGEEKELSFFPRKKRKDGSYWYALECKECGKPAQQKRAKKHYRNNKKEYLKRQNQYYEDHRNEISVKNKKYALDHQTEIRAYKKQYAFDNVTVIASYQKRYREDNQKAITKKKKEHYDNNKQHIIATAKEYYHDNKEEIKPKRNQYFRDRWVSDITYRLRKIVSSNIRRYLKTNGFSKFENSCLLYLSYSLQDLRCHLESQFELWMDWTNQGKYDFKSWDDNDSTTWTWQIDHIIPQSDLPYMSMSDENFKKCWSLENLRPLSAKQNIIDGSGRVRHKRIK